MSEIVKRRAEAFAARARQTRLAALERAENEFRDCACDPRICLEAARWQFALGRYEDAAETFRRGIAQCPPSARLYAQYVSLLKESNRTAEAIATACDASLLFPAEFLFVLKERLLLPILYADTNEIERYRARYAEGLREIAGSLSLDTAGARRSALEGLGRHVNFLLAYQGRDDRDLQALYGGIAHRIMAATYPQWAKPVAMPADNGRLRIGYLSAHMRNHSVSKTHSGWLREHTGERFEIFAYHTGKTADAWTEDIRRGSAGFRHLRGDMDEICRTILADSLHVLVFLDVGMDPRTTQLAALRLAPVQCVTWGHPMTSGLPTIDYFLSGEAMEPADAQRYYTEKLVCLPGLGVCWRPPAIPKALFRKTRADFGIRHDATAYLSCQSPAKYLPQDDDIYPAIAKLIPESQFVFIGYNDLFREDFRRRLDGAFSTAGVRMAEHVVFVPHLDQLGYWNLNAVCDICLDTLGWSGCNSTLEAIACGLPVVTLPGRFMRGRHSCAILTLAGVTDTIATDKAGYVEIAVRLATDPAWRARVVEALTAAYPKICSDKRSVSALEDFYGKVTREGERAPC